MVTPRLRNSKIFQINLLTSQEVAERAKVSTKTVYRWISDGKIPAIRLGKRTYRIPEQADLNYPKNIGYGHLLE